MNKKTALILVAGPSLLLLTFILLFAKAAPLIIQPVWFFGMALSVLLACLITCLSIQEYLTREKGIERQREEKEKELDRFKSILEQAHALHRRKIDALEEEAQHILDENKEIKIGYEKLYSESAEAKSCVASFRASLEDALSELRALRQSAYLDQETQKLLPKDLFQQHKQLREQFEEKSMILEQTRRRLFALEGSLHMLKQENEEEAIKEPTELLALIGCLCAIERENAALTEDVIVLEALVSSPPKPPAKRAKEKVNQMLERQFDTASE